MFRVLFGEWTSGRVQRLAYLGYYLLTIFFIVVIALGIAVTLGFLNKSGMSLKSIEDFASNGGGIVTALVFVVFIFAMFIAQLNILAKRIRDMGLPALVSVVALIILSIVLNVLYPPQEVTFASSVIAEANATMASAQTTMQSSTEVSIFGLIVFLLLLFVPSDAFKRD